MTGLVQALPSPRARRGAYYSDFQSDGRNRWPAIGLMAIAHVLLAYGLANGLAGKAMEVLRKPLEASIVQEVVLPPPPPPPPRQERQSVPTPAPSVPPPYVPPPEVTAAPSVAPTISAIQQVAAVPAPPPAPPPAPAPVVAPAPAAPAKADITLACPRQARPEVPARAVDDGIEGVVRAEARVREGRVVDVRILSGPRIFHNAVRTAMLSYKCNSTESEVVAVQEFNFRIE